MKRMQRVFGDLDALRFVDGGLDDERRAAFLSHLADEPAEAERVAVWSRQNESLRRTFAGIALEPLPVSLRLGNPLVAPTPLPRPIAGSATSVRHLGSSSLRAIDTKTAAQQTAPPPMGTGAAHGPRLILGAALLVAFAVLVVVFADGLMPRSIRSPDAAESVASSATNDRLDRAADAFSTYALDPVRPVEIPASQVTVLNRWLSQRLGLVVQPPDLAAEGWRLLGGRLVPGSSGPAAFFVYENADKARLGLLVERAARGVSTLAPLGLAGTAGAVLSWVRDPLAYAVVVDKSLDWLSRNSENLKARIAIPAL